MWRKNENRSAIIFLVPARISVDNTEPDNIEPHETAPVPTGSPAPNAVPDTTTRPQDTTTDREARARSGNSPLAAFAAFPAGIHFSGEHDDERIVLFMRAHPITMLPWALVSLALLLGPIVLLPLLGMLGTGFGLGPGTALVAILFWYAGTFTYAFLNFLYWYFNVYIVTNERVVDVDWYSLTHREINVSQISKIQDVTSQQIGVLSGIFDYGHVLIQTAGTEPNFEFLNVPHPQLVVRKIQELMEEEEKEWETK
jgi:hypothetical protein